jgi:hypothetical protein
MESAGQGETSLEPWDVPRDEEAAAEHR